MRPFSPLAWTAGLFVVSLLFESGLAVLRPPGHRSAPAAEPPAVSSALTAPDAPASPITADRGTKRAQPGDSAAPHAKRAEIAPVARGSAPQAARMVIAVDPETGTLGMPERNASVLPTIDEIQAQARLEAEGLVTVRHADGSESIEHEGRFTDYVVLRIGPDGQPLFTCVHGTPGLHVAMRKDLPVRAAQEDK